MFLLPRSAFSAADCAGGKGPRGCPLGALGGSKNTAAEVFHGQGCYPLSRGLWPLEAPSDGRQGRALMQQFFAARAGFSSPADPLEGRGEV
jgi:hypothetical protein